MHSSAHEVCKEIFEEANRILSEAPISEIRQATVAAVSIATEVELLMASIEGEHESGRIVPRDPTRVLSTIDLTHGRIFNRRLAILNWSRTSGNDALVGATRELVAADVTLEWTACAGQSVNAPLQARNSASQDLVRVAQACGTTVPDHIGEGALPDFAAGRDPNTSLLSLTVVKSGIVCLSIEADGGMKTWHLSWDRGQRDQWSVRLKAAQEKAGRALKAGGTPKVASNDEDIEHLYAELAERFSAPIAQQLGDRTGHLVVALHTELATLPLWSIARFLPDLALSIVPTLRSASLLAQRTPAVGTTTIGIGDVTCTLRMAPWETGLMGKAATLAGSIDELAILAKDARQIHFACHGEFDAENPYSSGLILRGVNRSPFAIPTARAGCVRLTIPGILKWLDLGRCELITLSACSVGTPRVHAASEFTSVATAFLLAGARHVIAANWPVHDAATAVLMYHFYRAQRTQMKVPAALAFARKNLLITTRDQALEILGREDVLPVGDLPFSSAIFSDAFMHYGVD
jgi:hypothetical protein